MKTEFSTQIVRQGDVLLIPTNEPKNSIPVENAVRNQRFVLAKGETTMHEHTVAIEDAELVREGEAMLLRVLRTTPMTVTDLSGRELDRHEAISVAPGTYRVITQRELDITTMRNRPASD